MKIVQMSRASVEVEASCAGCQFFVPAAAQKSAGGKDGNCHAAPPAAAGAWPQVDAADWCGAFEQGGKS